MTPAARSLVIRAVLVTIGTVAIVADILSVNAEIARRVDGPATQHPTSSTPHPRPVATYRGN